MNKPLNFSRLMVAGSLLISCWFSQHSEAQEVTWSLVEQSSLPSGGGIAASATVENPLKDHPKVIFMDDFERGELGEYWDEIRNDDNQVLSYEDCSADDVIAGRRCLRVTATLNHNTGGGLTKWFSSSERIFIRFYTKFDPSCDYIHHFCTLRANKGLNGSDKWSGFGGAGLKPNGIDRFSTAIEPWGDWGKLPAPGKWNFYSYWSEMKAAPDGKYWGNSFAAPKHDVIPKDKWICVEFMIHHNTPGVRDGEQAFWIDGQLAGHWKGIMWRTSPELWANALTVESYVTDNWTKNPVNIVYFDNVVIAKDYIGPSSESH